LLGNIGTVDRSLHPINSSARLNPFCRGIDLYVNIARQGSSHFFKNPFIVWTPLSASPLLAGYLGLLVACLKPYDLENALKLSEEN